MLLMSDIVLVVRLLFIFNINTRHSYDKKRLIYNKKTSLQHFCKINYTYVR